MEQQPEFLSVEEAANVLSVGVPTVQNLIDQGVLTTREHGGEVVVPYDALLAFLREDQRKLMEDKNQPGDLG